MPEDEYVRGSDVVRADDGYLVVVRVRDGELPLEDVEQPERAHHLRLHGAERRRRLLEVRELVEEGAEVARSLLDRHAVDQQRHGDVPEK